MMTGALELIDHPVYGHCAVAREDIPAGTIVLEEQPDVLLLPAEGDRVPAGGVIVVDAAVRYRRRRAYMQLGRSAQAAVTFAGFSASRRADLLSYYHIPDKHLGKQIASSQAYRQAKREIIALRTHARASEGLFPELTNVSERDLFRFALAVLANAHQVDDDGSAALLRMGAKVSHACRSTNVAVSTRSLRSEAHYTVNSLTPAETEASIKVRHIATRPIAKGQVLFNTYADVALDMRDARRKTLLDGKLFVCECVDCAGEVELFESALPAGVSPALVDRFLNWEQDRHEDPVTRADEAKSWTSTWYSLAKRDNLYTTRSQLEWLGARALAVADIGAVPEMTTADYEELEKAVDALVAWFGEYQRAVFGEASREIERPLLDHLLTLSESLVQRAAIQSDQLLVVSTGLELCQKCLLLVRPAIEARRSWPIGHVLESDYDTVLVDLNELVLANGGQIEE
ncbi:hypothetical protein PYCC9005_002317 [Savitreella phatthalungensis]